MPHPLRALAVFACAAAVYAQAPQAAPGSAPGLEASWEIAPVLNEIAAHAGRLLPLLDKVDVQAWVAKGASDTYAEQLQSSKEQARALVVEAKALAGNPEQLSAELQLVFRIQGLETMLTSLGDAIRRYQTPADAQALAAVVAQNGAGRDRLQRYVVNLAAEREQDLKVMDREAQRCRGILTQAPPKTKEEISASCHLSVVFAAKNRRASAPVARKTRATITSVKSVSAAAIAANASSAWTIAPCRP